MIYDYMVLLSIYTIIYTISFTINQLMLYIYRGSRPQITILWRLPGTTIYRNVKQDGFQRTNGMGRWCIGGYVLVVRVFFWGESKW